MFVALRRTIRSRVRAFSLFELVAVLVIIGALAAVAVPRVVVLTGAAHHAKVASIAAAFDTGIRIASLRCVIAGWEGKDNLPGYADATVDFNATCFPTDTIGNANTIAGNASRCVIVWNVGAAGKPARRGSRADRDADRLGHDGVLVVQFVDAACIAFQHLVLVGR